MQRKTQVIRKTPALHKHIVNSKFESCDYLVCSDHYNLMSHDIRDAEGLGHKLSNEFGVDPTCPTFVLTECLLIYLQNLDSERILRWLATFFSKSTYLAILNYEMITPHDSFGQTMIHNLMERGCDLLGIEGCPSL